MITQQIRLFLFAAIIVVGMLLYNVWREEHPSHSNVSKSIATAQSQNPIVEEQDIPQVISEESHQEESIIIKNKDRYLEVKTDVLNLTIDKVGGDIVHLTLSTYAENEKAFGQGFVLFDQSPKRYYIAQSGLTGEQGPDLRGIGRAKFKAADSQYQLANDQDKLTVDLKTTTKENVEITKRFVLHRSSYVIDIEYLIDNRGKVDYKGNFYARLKRKANPSAGSAFLGIQTFTGAALRTPDVPFKKISFKDIENKPLEQSIKGGWAAMVEHYFVSAWIPPEALLNTYQTNKLGNEVYSIGLVEPSLTVVPGEKKSIHNQLYAGPEITETLESLAPGLELSVDYGMLWPICQPIFWLLKKAFQLTGNWGIAIILTTILIKLLFYKLSASSYRSMGNMRKLQPRLELLKERYGDDKQKFSQAVMELYKKEKINPLGGCLPVLIQIPVFIALYYVLLGSVELREAPFIGWITDLSNKDPYYILPILMGISMLIQQKLNPTPPDPVQAKVMMIMPAIFTVLFLNFPSGLVLYWLVNNILSIAQQWFITRRIESAAHTHGAK